MPVDDIRDLHREGLLLANLDREYGGLGYGVDGDDPLAFVLLVEHLAMVNPATAHCYQVHGPLVQMVSIFGNAEQRQRWLAPTLERGALLGGVGSEPRGAPSTTARSVPGGYEVDGVKYYATNVPLGEWFEVPAGVDGQPGARMRLMINRTRPGVTVDSTFWRPMGMRACVSPIVHLDKYFVPEEDVLGQSSDPRAGSWLGKFHTAFAANCLGTAQGMYDWIIGYLRERPGGDPYRTLRVGELKSQLDATRLLLYRAAEYFKRDRERAMLMGCEAKWMAKTTLNNMLRTGGEIAGSTALFEIYPLERMYRDAQLHLLHSRIDITAQTVGAAELGEEYNINRER